MTRVVDEEGHVAIPAKVCSRLGICPGSELEIDVHDGAIIMRPKRKVFAKDLLGITGKRAS